MAIVSPMIVRIDVDTRQLDALRAACAAASKPDHSRLALFYVGRQQFAALIGALGSSVVSVRPVCRNLPADAVIQDVTFDFIRAAWLLRVHHASFQPVPDGEPLPVLGRLEVEVERATEVLAGPRQLFEAGERGIDEPHIVTSGSSAGNAAS